MADGVEIACGKETDRVVLVDVTFRVIGVDLVEGPSFIPVVSSPLNHSSARPSRSTVSPMTASRLLPFGCFASGEPGHWSASHRRAEWLNLYWMSDSTASMVAILAVMDVMVVVETVWNVLSSKSIVGWGVGKCNVRECWRVVGCEDGERCSVCERKVKCICATAGSASNLIVGREAETRFGIPNQKSRQSSRR